MEHTKNELGSPEAKTTNTNSIKDLELDSETRNKKFLEYNALHAVSQKTLLGGRVEQIAMPLVVIKTEMRVMEIKPKMNEGSYVLAQQHFSVS
jgi:hypothetical protein